MPGAIGRYDLKRELGRGMMGVVYEAVDRELGRRVAVKVIHLAFSASDQERTVFEQRFLEEARAAAALAHPGIVVVHDVGRDPGTETVYMVLEYVEGRTLAEAIKSPVPWRRALEITAQVAR